MSIIKVNDLSVSYGKKQVINQISFEVCQGEILGVLGLNGSGKSTLVKAICNILPHLGNCSICDKDTKSLSIKQLASLCSYVPQKSGLSIDMTVLDVVLMGFNSKLKIFEEPDNQMKEKAKALLEETDLRDKINNNFLTLSEGQKKLCIILRALVTDSAAVLMDEPESALDVTIRHRFMNMIKKWTQENDKAVMVVLHDTELALNYCDRILLISDGKCAGIIDNKNDSLEEIENKLSKVYGKICLTKVNDHSGKSHMVMLKEEI